MCPGGVDLMPVHQAAFFAQRPRRKASTEFEVVNVTLVARLVANPTKAMVTDNLYAECFVRKTLTSPSRARDDGLGSRHSDTGCVRQALGVNPSSWVVRNADDRVFAPIVR